MPFTPISSKTRGLQPWFATRPDVFTRERSPRKTTTWAIVGGLAAILTVIVLVNADAVPEILGGNRRSGLAIIGAFAFPPAIAVFSLVMMLVGANRWRVAGGGVLKNSVVLSFGRAFPVERLLAAVRTGTDSSEIIDTFRAAEKDPGRDVVLTVWSSKEDRVLYAGVLRVDGNRVHLDREPIAVSGERWFDAKEHQLASLAGRTTLAG
ncbi:MAG: hypothetical protein ACTH31_11155 [Pseudoclavibacter sp.]